MHVRRKNNLPSNVLAFRGFTRGLIQVLLGPTVLSASYEKVAEAFDEKSCDGVQLGRTAFYVWQKGDGGPGPKYKPVVDKIAPGLTKRWLYRSFRYDRLQCHLSVFDLFWIKQKHPEVDVVRQAWEVLHSIHREWGPGYDGYVFIPGPEVGGHRNIEKSMWRFIEKLLVPNSWAKIPFGTLKGPLSLINKKANSGTKKIYEKLNPSSVLPFMLCFAVESKLPGPGLKEAFILDFLSAVFSTLIIIGAVEDGWAFGCTNEQRIGVLCERFFINDNEDTREDEIEGLVRYLKDWGCSSSEKAIGKFLCELKVAYFSVLSQTATDKSEIVEIFHKCFNGD